MKNNKIESITVVAGNYPAPGRMNQVFVQQLVHAMIDQGIKVVVVAPQRISHALYHRVCLLPKYSKAFTENGIEYDIYRPYILAAGKSFMWFNKHIVKKYIKKIKSDVIYTHFWGSAQLVYKYAIQNGIPLFVACGESGDLFSKEINSLSLNTIKELSIATTGVISVSSENKKKCIEYYLSKPKNIEVFPNCIEIDKFHRMNVDEIKIKLGINKNDFVISFVGNFNHRKGPERVAEAISKLNDLSIKVMFIGKYYSGYEYDFNCPGIIHKGPLDHDLLPKYLNCSDVFVLPTRSEGCCNAIVEALAIGLPVISSEGAFNDDILDKYNSIRVDPDDVDAIASAIKKLKEDAQLRQQMSEYSISRREEYSINGRAKKILKFINNLVCNIHID